MRMIQQNTEEYDVISMEVGKWRQFMAAIIINLSVLTCGVMTGWISPTIPQLVKENPPVGEEPMTEDEISWLTSVMSITPLLALPFCAWSSEKFGRKITGCCITIPATISWLLVLFAQNFYYLLIVRLLVGLVMGLTFSLVPVYVAELSAETIRGQLGCYLGFGINIGTLIAFTFGAILSYRHFAIFGLIVPVVFFLTLIFIPETPTYLIRKGRIMEPTRSLMWLKSNDETAVSRELCRLQQQFAEMSSTNESAKLKDLFRDRGTIKGFIISLCLLTGQQTSGFSIVIKYFMHIHNQGPEIGTTKSISSLADALVTLSYAATIFELANSSLSPNNAAIALAIIQIVGSVLSTLIIERSGRRPLLLISCATLMICHLVFGIFFFLQNEKYDLSSFAWLPLVALSSYALAYSIGLGPAAYVVAAEIFSPDIASLGTSVSMLPVFLTNFATLKLFPFVTSNLGSHIAFFILSSFCAYTFLITYFLLPETKGKSIESIFEKLNSRLNEKKDLKKISA